MKFSYIWLLILIWSSDNPLEQLSTLKKLKNADSLSKFDAAMGENSLKSKIDGIKRKLRSRSAEKSMSYHSRWS